MSASSTTAAPIEFDGLVKRFGRRTVLDDLSFTVPRARSWVCSDPTAPASPRRCGCCSACSARPRGTLGSSATSRGQAGLPRGDAPGRGDHRGAAAVQEPERDAEPRDPRRGHGPLDAGRGGAGILNRVGLADRADDPVGSFSLGMRQRVGIALALVGDPAIVVLDEPTNGLDPEGAVEVRNLVRSLPERGATTLLCTHRLAEVEATCDYVVLLQNGRLVTQGTLRRRHRRRLAPAACSSRSRRTSSRRARRSSPARARRRARRGRRHHHPADARRPVGRHPRAGRAGHLPARPARAPRHARGRVPRAHPREQEPQA